MGKESLDRLPDFGVNVLESKEETPGVAGYDLLSDNTSDLPTDTLSGEGSVNDADSLQAQQDAVILVLNTKYATRRVPASYPGNPGWPRPPREDRRGAQGRSEAANRLRDLICYLCYEKGHLATQCRCRDVKVIVDNFNALTFHEKTTVPWQSFLSVTGKLNEANASSTGEIPQVVAVNGFLQKPEQEN